jgi:transposase
MLPDFVFNDRVKLEADEWKELRALTNGTDTPAPVATRARIVLWRAEGRQKKEIAALAGVSRPTVDLWLTRYAADGVAGLLDRPGRAGREQVPAAIRARVLAASRTSPPVETGTAAALRYEVCRWSRARWWNHRARAWWRRRQMPHRR